MDYNGYENKESSATAGLSYFTAWMIDQMHDNTMCSSIAYKIFFS